MNQILEQSTRSDYAFQLEGMRLAGEAETGQWLLDDGEALKTTWTVYDRIFADGQREVCATRTTRLVQKSPLPLPCRAKRGESENREQNVADSAKRAKQTVRLRCKAISADRMITLTYRENMQDWERLKADWDTFRRKMGRCKTFHYVAVVERQQRGAFHIHVAVHGRQVYNVVRAIWYGIVGKNEDGKPNGQINVRDPHKFGFTQTGRHKLAAYISKYITKDCAVTELNKKRYWTSRGIVVPEKNYYQLPYGTDEHDACVYVMETALGHNKDGIVFFSNSSLGCCWAATAPTPS